MCFSASASFTASAALSLIGLIALYRVRSMKQYWPLASIPLIFGIQQAVEGAVWLGLTHENFLMARIASYAFLLIATVVWPLLVPYALYNIEPVSRRKAMLHKCLFIGLLMALLSAGVLVYMPLLVTVQQHHIVYFVALPISWSLIGSLLYVGATVAPFVISTRRCMRWFALLLLLSYGIASWAYWYAHTSVWCFFAALLSVLVITAIHETQR